MKRDHANAQTANAARYAADHQPNSLGISRPSVAQLQQVTADNAATNETPAKRAAIVSFQLKASNTDVPRKENLLPPAPWRTIQRKQQRSSLKKNSMPPGPHPIQGSFEAVYELAAKYAIPISILLALVAIYGISKVVRYVKELIGSNDKNITGKLTQAAKSKKIEQHAPSGSGSQPLQEEESVNWLYNPAYIVPGGNQQEGASEWSYNAAYIPRGDQQGGENAVRNIGTNWLATVNNRNEPFALEETRGPAPDAISLREHALDRSDAPPKGEQKQTRHVLEPWRATRLRALMRSLGDEARPSKSDLSIIHLIRSILENDTISQEEERSIQTYENNMPSTSGYVPQREEAAPSVRISRAEQFQRDYPEAIRIGAPGWKDRLRKVQQGLESIASRAMNDDRTTRATWPGADRISHWTRGGNAGGTGFVAHVGTAAFFVALGSHRNDNTYGISWCAAKVGSFSGNQATI